ncbi:MAG: glycosyltransferase [bacterium]|nr:glycosyltransferase [bacterium]
MAITHTFQKSPFELLRQRREELFTSRQSGTDAFLGMSTAAPRGLTNAALGAIQRDGRVLMLGNGRSEALAALATHNAATMLGDWSSSALAATEEARRQLSRRDAERVRATLITGARLPFADASFDGITLTGIACELEHATPLWKECARLLANDGQLIVSVPDELAHFHSEFTRLWNRTSLEHELMTWFEEVEVTSEDGILIAQCSNRLNTRHPRITTMMNIRNEDRWLREVLDSAARVSDAIVVYDDGSTDKTQEICQIHPAVAIYQRGEENETDKARDKNRLYDLARGCPADWVLCLDGDEVLEASAPRRLLECIQSAARDVTKIEFEFLYLWNDRAHYRTDGIYTGIFHPCLFRPGTQAWDELRFEATGHGGNLHCERVPQNLRGEALRADLKIEHLGYMYAEDRLRKYYWNKGKDPKHAQAGYYEHLLDQPHMTLAAWNGRPDAATPKRNATQKQTLKPDYYYANARRNLAERVPRAARNVLDVGCGNGATGKLIKELTGARVTGIEIHHEVAAVARQVLDEVHVLDVEAQELPNGVMYDCILLGDVLEHLIDPWGALRKLAARLAPNGSMIASLPNVRNLGVISKLLEGSWNYAEYGILDSTHLRFFAKNDMITLFAQAGLRAEVVEIVRDPLFEQKMPPRETRTLDMGDLVLRNLAPQDIDELTAQQFIFMAIPDASVLPKPEAVASVVIPVFNNLRFTRTCLESLYHANETTAHEIIVVDDGSTDGTAEYLAAQGERIRVIRHDRNYGFARSCNDGARAAAGQVIVFLNNDTEVLPGWLDAMVEALRSDRRIGIVGNLQIFPDTMRVQQAGIGCDEHGQVHSIYNGVLPANHPVVQKPREFQFIAGSCLTIWRQLFMEVGGFDEAYLNSCEDIDLCMRVTQTGRKIWYCPQSRIYHYESRTVAGHDKNGANYRLLLSRWKDSMVADAEQVYASDGFQMLPDGRVIPLEQETPSMPVASTPDRQARVALLSTYQQRCGLAIYAEQLRTALETAGESVLVLAERTDDVTAVAGADVIRCWSRDAQGGGEIVPLLQAHRIGVLHVNHGGMFALDGWLLDVLKQARALGIRVVTTFHSTETRDERLADIARHSEQCFVHHRQNIVELAALGAPAERIQCSPIPLPDLQFADLAEAKLLLEWDPAQKIVATFGMIDPHKGVRELIEALPELRKFEQAKLLIVGAPHPDSATGTQYLIECMQRVKELQLEDHVRFLTDFIPEDELTVTLQACDVLVLNYLSSRFEGSACLTRALATGRPVVTSTAPALDVAAPVTLCTTEQFDLPRAMLRALTNPFLTQALRDAVMDLAARSNWQTTADTYRSAYDAVLAGEQACTTDLLKFYATHPDEIYNEPLQRERVRWLASKATGRILEIGPANGYVVQFCHGHEAVDIYRERLDVARALRPGIAFNYGNVVCGLPYGDQSFDTVMSPEIFEHVEWEMAVTALKECMRVGKRVLITIPNADKPNYNPDLVHNPEHRWLVTRQLVDAWLAAAGAVDYEMDCSRDLDFYLLDINSTSKTPSRRVTERAAALPHFEVTPGPQLTVAFDASSLVEETLLQTESARYFVELLNHLRDARPEWKLLLATERVNELKQKLAQAGGANAFQVIGWQQLSQAGAQAIFLPNPILEDAADYLQMAKQCGMITACAMNDLIPLAYPQLYLTHDPLARERYVQALRAVNQVCDLLFCTTQATLQELQIRLGMPLARLRTIHGGPTLLRGEPLSHYENAELRTTLHGDTPFFLCTGELGPVKNLRLILEAARALPGHVKLVLAYPLNAQMAAQLREAARRDGFPAESLLIPTALSDNDLARLFARATGLVSPSLMEGLALPLVNALSFGTPIIAGDTLAQRETCGDAALYVDPLNSGELAQAMRSLLGEHELRRSLKQAALAEAPRFDWSRSAEKLAVYITEAVVKSGGLTQVKQGRRLTSQPQ